MSLNSNTTGLEEILASVNALPEAGGEPTLQEKTVSPTTVQQQVTPDSGFDGLSKVTVNAMPTATQATPSISVSSAGLITASATQTAGYVSAGTKSATKQLTTQAAKTITPTTSSQTAVASGRYTTGAVTVAGDANLVAGNIKSGVSIFGVAGSYEGSGGGGSVETCTVKIKTATDNGQYLCNCIDTDWGIHVIHNGMWNNSADEDPFIEVENVIIGTTFTILTFDDYAGLELEGGELWVEEQTSSGTVQIVVICPENGNDVIINIGM